MPFSRADVRILSTAGRIGDRTGLTIAVTLPNNAPASSNTFPLLDASALRSILSTDLAALSSETGVEVVAVDANTIVPFSLDDFGLIAAIVLPVVVIVIVVGFVGAIIAVIAAA